MASMLRRRPAYTTRAQTDAAREQIVMDYDAPAPAEPVEAEPVEPVADQAAAETQSGYDIQTGWRDTAGKTRTWVLCEPSGAKLAEITTRSAARKLADLLNGVESKSNGRGR